jgi:hypothetical protein
MVELLALGQLGRAGWRKEQSAIVRMRHGVGLTDCLYSLDAQAHRIFPPEYSTRWIV